MAAQNPGLQVLINDRKRIGLRDGSPVRNHLGIGPL